MTFGFGMNILENFWQDFFVNHIGFYLLIVVPLFTMRLIAEERRLGTIELLYTYPLRDGEIMIAKFVGLPAGLPGVPRRHAALSGDRLRHSAVRPEPVRRALSRHDRSFSPSCIACGLFVSSLTDSQVVASSCTFVLLLLFWIITWNEAAVSSTLLTALSQLSTFDHFFSFARGVIDLKDVDVFRALHRALSVSDAALDGIATLAGTAMKRGRGRVFPLVVGTIGLIACGRRRARS